MRLPLRDTRARPRLTIGDVLQSRTDLSTFVVHLTRDSETMKARDNLISIVQKRTLLAGEPKGWATWDRFGLDDVALSTQRVVCFSETPLEHVHSLFAEISDRALQFRGYGVAFPKMIARLMDINPVWYIDLSLASGTWRDLPLKDALNALVIDARSNFAENPISRLAPFIEGMGTFPNGNGGVKRREFSWEREWRHLGDLDLAPWWSKALWLCPEEELDQFRELAGDGAHCIDPTWGLERIVGHLMGMTAKDMTPFAAR